jgi:hypothetical protein
VPALLAALAAYLAFWPVPIDPVAWPAPAAPGYQGAHAANTRLAGLTLIPLPPGETGPERVVLGRDGKLYAAVASGRILRMNADGSAPEIHADTGGRPLGFDFDAAGRLIVADAFKGLLAIDGDRRVTVLANTVNGDPIRYADAVVAARSGRSTSATRRAASRRRRGAAPSRPPCSTSSSSAPPAASSSSTRRQARPASSRTA